MEWGVAAEEEGQEGGFVMYVFGMLYRGHGRFTTDPGA